jgi:hypothetical protein
MHNPMIKMYHTIIKSVFMNLDHIRSPKWQIYTVFPLHECWKSLQILISSQYCNQWWFLQIELSDIKYYLSPCLPFSLLCVLFCCASVDLAATVADVDFVPWKVLAWYGLIGSSEGVGANQAHICILKIVTSATEYDTKPENIPF